MSTSDRLVVTVRRSGGFAGIARSWSVDAAALPAADAAELRRLAAGVVGRSVAPARRTPDAFQYEVEVAGGDAPCTVAVDRASAAELLDFVVARDPLQ